MCKKILPVYKGAESVEINRDFPKLWSRMYCQLFYGSPCIFSVAMKTYSVFQCSTVLFQIASALPLSIGRHSGILSDTPVLYQQPPSGRQFDPQLEMGRPPSWLIPYPRMPLDSAAAYHSFSTNVASAHDAESIAARGSAVSPKLTAPAHDRAAFSHPSEGATYQRPARAADKEPGSRSASLMPHAAWSRERPHPAAESTDFAGHFHGMNAAPLHPLKQVLPHFTHIAPYHYYNLAYTVGQSWIFELTVNKSVSL